MVSLIAFNSDISAFTLLAALIVYGSILFVITTLIFPFNKSLFYAIVLSALVVCMVLLGFN